MLCSSVGGGKPKRFACKFCKNTFGSRSNMKRHIKEVHERKEEYQCRRCGAILMLQRDMKRHLRNLHGKEQWSTPWMANFIRVNCQAAATSTVDEEMSFETEHDPQLDFLLSDFIAELPQLDDIYEVQPAEENSTSPEKEAEVLPQDEEKVFTLDNITPIASPTKEEPRFMRGPAPSIYMNWKLVPIQPKLIPLQESSNVRDPRKPYAEGTDTTEDRIVMEDGIVLERKSTRDWIHFDPY